MPQIVDCRAEQPESEERARRENGSALLLFPAGILIMVVLAAIAVDLSATFLAQRELRDATAAAANDAASALASGSFYTANQVALDSQAVESVARHRVAQSLDVRRHLDVAVTVRLLPATPSDCRPTVVVEATARVRPIFAGAVEAPAGPSDIAARSAAQAHSGPARCG